MFDETDPAPLPPVQAVPPMPDPATRRLFATDHRRPALAPPSAGQPCGEDPQNRDRGGNPRGRNRFVAGVAVGALFVGTLTLGGFAGAALTRSDEEAAPTVRATPVALGSTGPLPNSVHALVTTVRPSIVAIHTEVTATDQFGQQAIGTAAGTGWVLSSDGYLVTNSHVVADSTTIEVSFDDGSTADATLVGADPRSDLAVLRVDRTDLVPLTIGDSDAAQVGDGVVAIGNALDLGAEPTVTGGMVSAKDRALTEETGATLVNLIQTDAAISRGNSGGPLLDLNGRVIGINTAVAGQGQNIGFAISINSAMDFIEALRVGESPSHPLLGVNSAVSQDGSPGAVITDVGSGTTAAEIGLNIGDVVTAIDDEPIANPEDLGAAVARHKVGDSIALTIQRDGAELTLTGILGARDTATS